MKDMPKGKLISRLLLTAALVISPLVPASAADSFPMPPEPKWWKQTGLTDVRYGVWLPCLAEWNITTDCTQSIKMFKEDGTEVGDLTYKKPENFDPKTAVCLLYTSPSPRDRQKSRMPSSA